LQLELQEYQTIDLAIYDIFASRHHLLVKIRVFIDHQKAHITNPPYWDDCLGVSA